MNNRYDAIIVGGGIAGLTSGVYLSQSGKKILLIEKNNKAGGLINSIERDGFIFDTGARGILGPALTMLKDLKLDIDILPNKVSLGVEDKIIEIDSPDAVRDYKKLLLDLYPESKEEIDKFIKIMVKIMEMIDSIYGIDNPIFKNIWQDKEYLFKELLPKLPKFLWAVSKIPGLSEPSESYLKEIIKDPSLIDIISQHFFKATPTFFALSYFRLYSSYLYLKGGTGKLPEALVKKIEEYKGEILLNTFIREINADQQFVVDENNNRYYYKNLVWAGDLKSLYKITDVSSLAPKVRRKFQREKGLIEQGRPSESVFSLYLEVDLPVSYFNSFFNGHFFYTPSRQGLGDVNKSELRALLDNWGKVSREEVYLWLDGFLEYNTFEVSVPAMRDPELAPVGKSGLIISVLIEAELFYRIEEDGWYGEFIREVENRIICLFSDSLCSLLRDKVMRQFSFSPLSFERRVNSTGGAIVGWSFESLIPVANVTHVLGNLVNSPVPGVFQVGQWAYSPAGVPTCVITGKLAADRIVKRLKRSGE